MAMALFFENKNKKTNIYTYNTHTLAFIYEAVRDVPFIAIFFSFLFYMYIKKRYRLVEIFYLSCGGGSWKKN